MAVRKRENQKGGRYSEKGDFDSGGNYVLEIIL